MLRGRTERLVGLSFVLVACACSSSSSEEPGSPGSEPGATEPPPPDPQQTLGGGVTPPSPNNGTCASRVTEAKHAEVDIIIVVDTSGSMSEETAQVRANLNNFASSIGSSGLDYRVIVIAEKPYI